MTKTNPIVDDYIDKAKKWQAEMQLLRMILLDCKLSEDLKWAKPCYIFEGANIVIVQGFKESIALMFFKGVLLKDTKGILEKPGENSEVAKRIRFTSIEEITELEAVLRAYIKEAIEIEKSGVKVDKREKKALILAEELQTKLNADAALKTAFESLTPGRQREYNLHFSSAKQAKTREARVEKCIERILEGKGLTDRLK